jgi:AAA family ATPase
MADFSSNTFTVRAADQINVRGRAVRRIFLSNHAMKLAKLFAGDVVGLTAISEICQQRLSVRLLSEMRCQKFIAFPSRDNSQWARYGHHQTWQVMVSKLTDKGYGHHLILVVVELATTLLLTARISEGSKAVIFHLGSINVATRPAWLPSIKEAHHADTVRLCKIDINGAPVITSLSPKSSEKAKQGDWLRLLLRESLGARPLVVCGYCQHSSDSSDSGPQVCIVHASRTDSI